MEPRQQEPAYRVTGTRKGEHSLVATRPISKGETVITEAASLRTSRRDATDKLHYWVLAAMADHSPLFDVESALATYMEHVVGEIPDLHTSQKGRSFMKRHGITTKAAKERIRRLQCVMATNCQNLPNTTDVGFFPTLAFVNHSCLPNCAIATASAQEGKLALVAARDIAADEEITMGYSVVFEDSSMRTTPMPFGVLPIERRQAHLKTTFGFDCKCPVCQLNRQLSVDTYKDYFQRL